MAIDDLFHNTAFLPKTVRGAMPYEALALTPREVWGHGHGQTVIQCRQKWNVVPQWIRYMVGEVEVQVRSQPGGARIPYLIRHIPERLRYRDINKAYDPRIQWCTGLSQIDQGGNPSEDNNTDSGFAFRQGGTGWPAALWVRYDVTWETTPYMVRDQEQIPDIAAGAGVYAGSRELYHYVVREKKIYSKEQPLPAGGGGFKVIAAAVNDRKLIGQVGFRVISMGDVVYKWIRVPAGWPPHPGWTAPAAGAIWPPVFNPGAGAPGTKRPTRDTFIGTINNDYFDCAAPEGYCWQPGELLYVGYEDYFYYDAAGLFVTDRTHRFKYKEGGWNKFISARGEWKEVSADRVLNDGLGGTAAGKPPYESNNFNNLFDYSAA